MCSTVIMVEHSCPEWDYICDKDPTIDIYDKSGRIDGADWCDECHNIDKRYWFKYCPYCKEELNNDN
jgi:hypothetical protein